MDREVYPEDLYQDKDSFLRALLLRVMKDVDGEQDTKMLLSASAGVLGATALVALWASASELIDNIADYLGISRSWLDVGGILGGVVGGYFGGQWLADAFARAFSSETNEDLAKKELVDQLLTQTGQEYERLQSLKERGDFTEEQWKFELQQLYDEASKYLVETLQQTA